jgi:hypothetical protein
MRISSSSTSSSSSCYLCARSLVDIPLPSEVSREDESAMYDAARRYKEQGLQRGTAWRLLYAEPRYRIILLAKNISAADIANKLKKEVYTKGVGSLLDNDAMRFIQAGILMRDTGGGYFE